MNLSAELVALVASGVVTVTSTVPVPAGETAVIDVAELTLKLVAAVGPKSTAVAPVKFVPVMLTDVPPPAGPPFGFTSVTVGGKGCTGSFHAPRPWVTAYRPSDSTSRSWTWTFGIEVPTRAHSVDSPA